MKIREIPQFTRNPNYRIDLPWKYLEPWIESQHEINLDLNPDFQRAHVWTLLQKSRYVLYCLRGGISGKEIYFNCVGWRNDYRGPFVLVDGKQRLSAVREFLNNQVPILDGLYYQDFEDKIYPTEPAFHININDLETRQEVLRWYLDLNDGGVVHTDAELNKVRALLEAEKGNGCSNKTIRTRNK